MLRARERGEPKLPRFLVHGAGFGAEAPVALKVSRVHAALVESVHARENVPGHGEGLSLSVAAAKGPVAEHLCREGVSSSVCARSCKRGKDVRRGEMKCLPYLKRRVVVVVKPNVLEIVVLSSCADTELRVDGATWEEMRQRVVFW